MKHLGDGTLRRLVDEPAAVSDGDRRHLAECARCEQRYGEIEAVAGEMALALSVPVATVDSARAYARLEGTMAVAPRHRRRSVWERNPLRIPSRPIGGLAAVGALVAALTLTPAGSLAQTFITIFQPTQIATVQVTSADLQSLRTLTKYGTVVPPGHVTTRTATTAAGAARLAGMPVDLPASLPASVSRTVRYSIVPGATASFTFNAAKARAAERVAGYPVSTMPARIDGSTLQVSLGTGVLATYGNTGDIPALAIGQMVAPRVTSTRVGVRELEAYVLGLPEVSPALRRQIEAIGDPTSTLILPVPVDRAYAQSVTVQGVPGLAFGDQTGVGSAVIWESHGMIHGVGGTMREGDVLAIANSLGT